MSSSSGYSPDRHEWARRMFCEHARPLYERFWPGCDVLEIGESPTQEPVARELDFSGLDTVIKLPGSPIHMAQRFRVDRKGGADFTVRYKPGEGTGEWDRLLDGHRTDHRYIPQLYAFGIGDGFAREDCLERGLRLLAVYDLPGFLDAYLREKVGYSGPIPNRDGKTYLIAFSLAALRPFVVKYWDNESGFQHTLPRGEGEGGGGSDPADSSLQQRLI